MNNLIESFFMDRNYRRMIYALGSLGSALYVSMNLMLLHRATATVTVETAVLSAFFLMASIAMHSAVRKNTPTNDAPIFGGTRLYPGFAMLVIVLSCILAISQSNFIVKIQAAVLEARIERVGQPDSVANSFQNPEQTLAKVQESSRKLSAIADVSNRYKIPVDTAKLNTTDQHLQSAAGHLKSQIATEATSGNTRDVPPSGYVINSALDLTNQRVRFVGAGSDLILSDIIIIKDSTVVFDGINLRARQPYFEAINVGAGSSVVIQNGSVENLSQTLDRVIWINVQFRNSMIKVGGAPFSLVHVSFRDCDLRWLEGQGGQVGSVLLKKIREANGGPITFTFDRLPYPPEGLSIRME
jgi:hypothetical protein